MSDEVSRCFRGHDVLELTGCGLKDRIGMERRHVLAAELKDGIKESNGDLEQIHRWNRRDDLAGDGGAVAPVLVGVISAEVLVSQSYLAALAAVGEDFCAETDFRHSGLFPFGKRAMKKPAGAGFWVSISILPSQAKLSATAVTSGSAMKSEDCAGVTGGRGLTTGHNAFEPEFREGWGSQDGKIAARMGQRSAPVQPPTGGTPPPA